jgi:hypothetical protein
MEALRQSLDRVSKTKKHTAKIGEPRAARAAKAPARKRARG